MDRISYSRGHFAPLIGGPFLGGAGRGIGCLGFGTNNAILGPPYIFLKKIIIIVVLTVRIDNKHRS
ncbi:MAG: hypothetical protein H6Q69_956 [Firmicutes bacterium]|nr:hypothetical protein [Bacillota bacterium]